MKDWQLIDLDKNCKLGVYSLKGEREGERKREPERKIDYDLYMECGK